jgi:hypothetical protein
MPFQKGHVANPHGRPKKSVEDKYSKAVYSAIKPADLKLIIEQIAKAAKRGDIQAAKLLMSYVLGMPVQKNEITGEDGGSIIVKLIDDKKR